MKKFLAGLVCGIVIATSFTAMAADELNITAIFNKVKLYIDGNLLDSSTLLYNGTTYVPMRAAAEALGKKVTYDADTYSAYIGNAPAPEATTEATTVATTNAATSFGDYQTKLAEVNASLEKGLKAIADKRELIESNHNQDLARYKTIDYTQKIAELTEEANKFKSAVTISAQNHYKEVCDSLTEYQNMQASRDASLSTIELIYKQQLEACDSDETQLRTSYNEACDALKQIYNIK